MNILIVDDEKLTRDGLISSVDWDKLGADRVETAANGADALGILDEYVPDIVITDVRMPRMNGIEMARAIQKRYPDISFIMMSGYSDREYLKEAIKLKAVSFIEKPISIPEVEESVRAAADKLAEKRLAERGHFVREVEESRRISNFLMRRQTQPEDLDTSFFPDMEKDGNFCCIITEFGKSAPPVSYEYLTETGKKAEDKLAAFGLHFISLLKDEKHICFFLYSRNISQRDAVFAVNTIREFFGSSGCLTIALGDIVRNIRNSYESYNSAVALLQQAFYCEENSDILEFEVRIESPPIITDRTTEFQEALSIRDKDECYRLLDEIKDQFKIPCDMLPSQAKDTYYKLFTSLKNAAVKSRVAMFLTEEKNSVYDMVDNATSCPALHKMLLERTEEFFELSDCHKEDNSIVFAIEEFVHMNYQNESLSVKSISEYVNRSTSYVCTLFRSETGMTLNRFITKYRLDVARDMLMDPRYKVTEIANRCGYNDVNYFGKIFKKYLGCSPSEYRGRNG